MKSKTLLPGCGKRTVIKPGKSRILISLVTTIYLSAILLLYFVELDAWFLFAAVVFILIMLSRHLDVENLNTHTLSLQQGGPLLLRHSTYPGWHNVEITESFVTSWIIVLRLRSLTGSKKASVVYAADSINSLSYRHLVIYLKHLQS